MVAILVLGFAATIASCFFAESLGQRRAGRRARARASEDEVDYDEDLALYGLDLYGPGWVDEGHAYAHAESYVDEAEYAASVAYADEPHVTGYDDDSDAVDDTDALDPDDAAAADDDAEYEYEYEYEYVEIDEADESDDPTGVAEPVPLPTFSFSEANRRLEANSSPRAEVLQAVRVSRLFTSDPEPEAVIDLDHDVDDPDGDEVDATIAIAAAGES
jgi:hypothetical protein